MQNNFFIQLQLLTIGITLVSSITHDPDNEIRHIIASDGYPLEEYHLKTQDGYFLKIHRIPGGKGEKINQTQGNKPIVFLAHALTQSSIDWVSVGRNRSLAYLLADKGFDVWMGNNRGTIFAQKHETYSTTDSKFWNFSWHESGIIDIPETIDFILNYSGKKQVFLVCYSQSCTELVITGSLRPEYNKKITLAVNMAPVVFMGNARGFLWVIFMFLSRFVSEILDFIGHFGITVTPLLSYVYSVIFNHRITTYVAFIFIYSLLGIDYQGVDMNVVRKQIAYIPGGMSSKQAIHYSFGVLYPDTFRQYDYGKNGNMRMYNSAIPPDYPLEKVTLPMVIFHGVHDYFATPKDIDLLLKKLPNVVCRYTEPKFNHGDFTWAKGLRKLVYEKIADIFINYKINQTCN